MKKILYIILIAVSGALAFTSCSDDQVNPKAGPTDYARAGSGILE